MGKHISWKDGGKYYDGIIETDWNRLKELEEKANENDEALFALIDAAYEENEIEHYLPYVEKASKKNHPLSLLLLARDMPEWSLRRHLMLEKAIKGGCSEAESYYLGTVFWLTWSVVIIFTCIVFGVIYWLFTRIFG